MHVQISIQKISILFILNILRYILIQENKCIVNCSCDRRSRHSEKKHAEERNHTSDEDNSKPSTYEYESYRKPKAKTKHLEKRTSTKDPHKKPGAFPTDESGRTGRVVLEKYFPSSQEFSKHTIPEEYQNETFEEYFNLLEHYSMLNHNIINLRVLFAPTYWRPPPGETYKQDFGSVLELSHRNNTCFFISLLQNILNNDGIRDYILRNKGKHLMDLFQKIYYSKEYQKKIKEYASQLFGMGYKPGEQEDQGVVLQYMFTQFLQIYRDKPLFYSSHLFLCENGCITTDEMNYDLLKYVTYPVCNLPMNLDPMYNLQRYLYGIKQEGKVCNICNNVNVYQAPFFSHAPSFLIFRRGSYFDFTETGGVLTFPFTMKQTIKVRTLSDGEAQYTLTGFTELIYGGSAEGGGGHYIPYIRRRDGYHKVEQGDFRKVGEKLHEIRGLDYLRVDCVFYQRNL